MDRAVLYLTGLLVLFMFLGWHLHVIH